MEKQLTALVTGSNGFVGSHLVDLLLKKNFSVKCLVRKSSNLKWLQNKNVEIIDCGLFDKSGLQSAMKDVDYIFHVAGVVKSKKPEGYFIGNADATKNLLEAALEFKNQIKKIVIVSSLTAVGPSKDELNPVDEITTPMPITTYGRSKLEQENISKKFMEELPITICRAPAVYGERDTEIFIFFKTYKNGLMTTIGFNKKIISLIHVQDLVYGFYLAAISNNSSSQIYFISSERFYTWDEIGNVCKKVFNKNSVKIKVPHSIVFAIAAIAQFFAMFSSKAATLNIEKAKDITQSAWICNTKKAVEQLGYKQNISLEEGIEKTVVWYKKECWL